MFEVIVAAGVIMLASLSGIVFVWKGAGKWIESNVHFLVTFSMGVFVVVVYSLFVEAFDLSGSINFIILGVLVGVIVFEILGRLIPGAHHHHDVHECEAKHSRLDAKRMLLSDAIHNVSDGILLVPAFLVDVRFGIAVTAGILVHEVVQEISEFFVLKEAGHSSKSALWINFLTSGSIFIGIAISLYVASASDFIGSFVAFAAGGFLYVIFRDLLPATLHSIKCKGGIFKHIILGTIGVLLMLGVNLAVPDLHPDIDIDQIQEEFV